MKKIKIGTWSGVNHKIVWVPYIIAFNSVCVLQKWGHAKHRYHQQKNVQQASKHCTKWRLHSFPPEFYKLEKEECTWKIENNETIYISTYFVILWQKKYNSYIKKILEYVIVIILKFLSYSTTFLDCFILRLFFSWSGATDALGSEIRIKIISHLVTLELLIYQFSKCSKRSIKVSKYLLSCFL